MRNYLKHDKFILSLNPGNYRINQFCLNLFSCIKLLPFPWAFWRYLRLPR